MKTKKIVKELRSRQASINSALTRIARSPKKYGDDQLLALLDMLETVQDGLSVLVEC